MKRYFKRRAIHSVSLFPFLAVLICTFGVLVVLLVLVVKAADHQASAKKQEVTDRNVAEQRELQLAVEFQDLKIEGLKSVRPALLKRLQQSRVHRAHLQSSIDSLNYEVDQVNDQIRLISNETEIDTTKPDESEIKRLEAELADEQLALETRRRTSAAMGRPTRYSIVPHDGPDGTTRRPIYIECLNDRLIIRPYDIELTKKDFVRPIVANNPLDAALIAVREYFLANKLNEVGQTPYPLLVVRPQGAESYSVARHAIRSWDEEFGYELVTAGKELDFGEPDLQLKQNIIRAIEASRKRQRAYIAQKLLNQSPHTGKTFGAGGFESSGQNSPGLQASSRHGGFVGPDGRVSANASRQTEANQNDFLNGEQNNSANGSNDAEMHVDGAGNGSSAMASIAQSQGNNWALPKNAAGSTGYRRPVVVHLAQNQIVVLNSLDATRNTVVSLNQQPAVAAKKLVAEVWKQVEGWGVAGVDGYWKPDLIVKVLPGGMQRYNELVQLMRGSGMEIREAVQ